MLLTNRSSDTGNCLVLKKLTQSGKTINKTMINTESQKVIAPQFEDGFWKSQIG